jgi:hypothetical protein
MATTTIVYYLLMANLFHIFFFTSSLSLSIVLAMVGAEPWPGYMRPLYWMQKEQTQKADEIVLMIRRMSTV